MLKSSVYDKLKKAEHGAFARVSAFTIYRGSDFVGKILVKHPKDGAGRLEVFVWDWTDKENVPNIQHGSATGFGYDKVAGALEGLTFAGKEWGSDWEGDLLKGGFQLNRIV
jgi:hypothetical protein